MKWIEIIETDRARNMCYIAWCQDKPYWATNWSIDLDYAESLLGYKLEDGYHDFIRIETEENMVEKGRNVIND